ncbi:putative ATPase [Sedimentisphaera cyanobacteriorum]|uniref:Putative ATPase n=1 Tax=Sedimentisphaera cyanobacteriorum TaxID=1940790 RepID=A0A1Q2HRX1_9BACT|nr:AAA family ATPase [Sedimentisphaera cyanobacteriorum]AQQ09996.1 putative ATPase [Sedimentisphaera cyanobacteriorum]
MNDIEILGCKVQNLRNYTNTTLYFHKFTLLVGENNEGKSSVLKMLEHLFNNTDKELLLSKRQLNVEEKAFWKPANESHHKARRFSLIIKVYDKRKFKKYGCNKDGKAKIRLSYLKSANKLRLNYGEPKQNEKANEHAYDLLEELKKKVDVVLIPAVRDAGNSQFVKRLEDQVDQSLKQKINPSTRGGTSKEYRTAKNINEQIKKEIVENSKFLRIKSEAQHFYPLQSISFGVR